MTQKLIIDTDIGTYYDDAFAVLLACRSPEIDLLGVTTVYGDTQLRARIARKVLNVAGRSDMPVFAGVGRPLQGKALMFGFEGQNILTAEDAQLRPQPEHAVNFLIRTIMEHPGEVTVVTLGAVSNLALAFVMEPAIAQHIKELIIMGGVIVPIVDPKGVRRSPIEEYNLNNDPIAAQIVFNSGMPITLCPIDVTLKVPLRPDQVQTINASQDPVARLVSSILAIWPPQERQIYLSVGIPIEHTGLWLHDPLTVALAFDKSFCEITRLCVVAEFAPTPIERDMLIRNDILRTIPKKDTPNMDVCVDVDAQRFTKLFTERVTGGRVTTHSTA
jgi:purine nucleosidase